MSARRAGGEARRSGVGDLPARVAVGLPALLVAALFIALGGWPFALAALALGLVAMHELFRLMDRVRPPKLAGFLALAALTAAALWGTHFHLMLVLVGCFPLVFVLSLARPRRANASWAIATTFLAILWIGLPVAHAVMLRELPHGAALLADVLIGTFLGDSFAYFGGRGWGRRPLAPSISPNKTLEGLVAGIVGGTFVFWLFAFAYQDWFRPGWAALVVGLAVALAAPVGDLFESLFKRDLDVKDTGGLFGAHGGALDRLDALLFTIPTAYYVLLAVAPFVD